MPSTKLTQLLTFALAVLPTFTVGDGITFCKLGKVPTPWKDHAECLELYDWNVNGCYLTPDGFAKRGQSWLVTHGYEYCRTYTDHNCEKTYESEEDWGAWRDNLGKDFYSFMCIPNPGTPSASVAYEQTDVQWKLYRRVGKQTQLF